MRTLSRPPGRRQGFVPHGISAIAVSAALNPAVRPAFPSDAATAADDLVWAEFAGTANMEVHLNRRAADWQVFPALEVEETATRHLAELVEESTAEQVRALRRHLTALNESGSPLAGLEWLVEAIEATPDNAALLAAVPR